MMRFVYIGLMGFLAVACSQEAPHDAEDRARQRESRRTATLPTATGAVGDVLVVVDEDWWNSGSLDTLMHPFTDEVYGLNQIEPRFDLVQIDPSDFNRIFRTTRNMIIIEKTAIDTVFWSPDKWARGQSVLHIGVKGETPSKELQSRMNGASDRMHLEESQRIYRAMKKSLQPAYSEHIQSLFSFPLAVPKDFRLNQKTPDLCWFTRQKPKAQQGVLYYELPFPDGGDFLQEISVLLDSVTQKHVLGELPNTYMEIERRFPVRLDWVDSEAFAGTIRGLWRMENDFMGGPFVVVFKERKSGDAIQVVHAYTFAPGEDKRNLMWELEVMARELLKH